MEKIRVRFAPSPTGYLTLGGARTALYNYLFARHYKGTFILRIEDTDLVRSTQAFTNGILESMNWLGMEWDEGPFFQSKRLDIYKKYAQQLIKEGKAFYREDPGKGTGVVFKMPEGAKLRIDDLIHGPIVFESEYLTDVVIVKSDGYPTYNFACVVDDSLMGITHIIRGDDHISNTPKQIALYEGLGMPTPKFAHIPLILGEDKSKLSKRHGHNSVVEYKKLGYLPDALFNFLSLLGWSPGENIELMPKNEIIERFTIERVKHTPAQFNFKKLDWMNSHYIKNLEPAKLLELVKPLLTEAGYNIDKFDIGRQLTLVNLYRERAETLRDFVEATGFLFHEDVTYNPEALETYVKPVKSKEVLQDVYSGVNNLGEFNHASLETLLRNISETRKLKFKDIAQPIRVALTGNIVSPGIFETMELAGKEMVTKRLQKALQL
ncbi:MAG: glutamate--tRNA ligase [Planctomycetes bacterium]|nr:glutamate--tRNA ligase [Planctomycetota bacterium]